MNEKYVYTEVPLTQDEARSRKEERIAQQLNRIESYREGLKEETDALRSICETPLETSRTERIAIGPDDPRYADAPVHFDPLKYQGDFTWVNGTPTDMRIAELEEVPEDTQRTGGHAAALREFRKYL